MTTAGPLSVDELCQQARECLKQRDFQGAIDLYEEAIRRNPDHIGAHEGLAAICFAKKDHVRTVELFRRVVALDPRRVEPLVNLGAAYNRKGDFADAIKTLRQALTRDRRCAAAYYNLGFAQRNAQQLSMAVSAFKEAIRLEPEMWEAYINLGQTLLELRNPAQALLNFERAVQLRPNSERARKGLLEARNRIEEAKNAMSPFGRLVNMEEVAQRNSVQPAKTQILTAEQRLNDRKQALRFTQECEHCSADVLDQIKSELSPAILKMSRLVNEQDPRGWGQGFENLSLANERFHKVMKILEQKLSDLKAHDTAVRNLQPED